jgi:transcriptional regulator of acetoin/glycerol metabolism
MSVERPLEKILVSRNRCAKDTLLQICPAPLLSLTDEQLQTRLQENALLCSIFVQIMDKIIPHLEKKYVFLLTDANGVLLSIKSSINLLKETYEYGIKPGMLFTEESIGTNAISLAMDLKKTIYIIPTDHYCDLLKRWYCYARPISFNDSLIGYFDVSTIEQPMISESIIIADLICDNIIKALKADIQRLSQQLISSVNLGEQDLRILELIAQGHTEQAISLDMQISINTVRYHKKKIFRYMDVHCANEAIVKAIKLGLLPMN